ncbi:MAG: diacylglycerol kinase [Treponema sp.]|nr:diacylglycerol kinase [Treponema sp.]
MNIEFFAEVMAEICAHSSAAPQRPLRWVVIANPRAGGFVMRSRWKKCRLALEESRIAARANPLREDCAPASTASKFGAAPVLAACGLVPTERPGSAEEITKVLVGEIQANTAPFYLLITAGGDGTSLEALSILYQAPDSVRSNVAVLRLPLGTGNDGADSPDLAAALGLLLKPSRIEFSPALRLITQPITVSPQKPHDDTIADSHIHSTKGPFLAFNILSVGLDAFVTHMTNKMKGKLPGDFYKLWVDIASLLYDKLYTVGFLDVRASNGQGEKTFREKVLLLAVGVSGHRTYGSQKKILPDDRNVCVLRQMPLLRKLALKGLFNTGKHIDKPEAVLFNARRVEISGEYPILAQMDGEAVLLQREDFPIVIELTKPVIPVFRGSL